MVEQGKSIGIWGTGAAGKRFYVRAKRKYDIACFYDNNADTIDCEIIDGIRKKRFEPRENYIVIASSYWREIANDLKNKGLVTVDDFMPSCFLQNFVDIRVLISAFDEKERYSYFQHVKKYKKIAVVFGNCQTTIIEKMLLMNTQFCEEYLLVVFPRICDYTEKEIDTLFSLFDWKLVDLFIHQVVQVNNRFSKKLATDRIKLLLSNTCRCVSILNLYFTGYFIQKDDDNLQIYKELHQSGLLPYSDKYVKELLVKGKSTEEIIECISKIDFLPKEEIEDNCKSSINELIKREQKVDVKISDYIVNHYKEEQLFYSVNHPRTKVLYEYTNRILRFLGYESNYELTEEDLILHCGTLKGQDIPVYPAVIHALELKRYELTYYPNRYALEEYFLSFNEYIKEYIDYYKYEKEVKERNNNV